MLSEFTTLNGVDLSTLNIYVVRLESGLPTAPFLPSQEIIEDYAMNNDVPYYFGTKKNPLELDVVFAKINGYWTWDERREFARLLTPDNDDYMEFYYHEDDEPVKVYYVKYTGGIDIASTSNREGYITVHFRCDSPYSYSQVYARIDDLSAITEPTLLSPTFVNNGDDYLYPELWIEKVGNGDVKIKNLTNAGKELVITDLIDGEIVYVNNEDGSIESSLSDTYRLNDHNGVYIELVRGTNTLQVTGKCKLTWKYKYRIKG